MSQTKKKANQRRYLQCPICYDTYNDVARAVRTLPCGHTLCRLCFIRLGKDEHVKCPFDRKVFSLYFPEVVKAKAMTKARILARLRAPKVQVRVIRQREVLRPAVIQFQLHTEGVAAAVPERHQQAHIQTQTAGQARSRPNDIINHISAVEPAPRLGCRFVPKLVRAHRVLTRDCPRRALTVYARPEEQFQNVKGLSAHVAGSRGDFKRESLLQQAGAEICNANAHTP